MKAEVLTQGISLSEGEGESAAQGTSLSEGGGGNTDFFHLSGISNIYISPVSPISPIHGLK